MGICNLTNDSFSDGGLHNKTGDALKHIKNMLKGGANIIDIGAESTRPGSNPISYQKEISKLKPILRNLPKNKFIISIDTNKIETQEYALKNGAHIINDIFGGSEDLFYLIKKYNSGLIIMHTPAPPKIMQKKINHYNDIIKDIQKFFRRKIKKINKYRISHKKIWLDPGIGFGKNLKQNLLIMKEIKKFRLDNCGLLLGSSRKSWIQKIDNSKVENRLGGSIASAIYSVSQNVDILRVHDVFETQQAINIYDRIKCSQ
tara:strand:+ start:12042 stop:12818 length:777 start_codon:yes stop_codon:yes gene_type:complete